MVKLSYSKGESKIKAHKCALYSVNCSMKKKTATQMVSQCIHIINCTIKILSRSDKKLNTNVITTFVKQHAIPYHISEVYCLNFLYADVAKEHTLIENYGKA